MSNSITCSRLVQMNKIWAHYDKDHPALCNVSMSVKRGSNYAIVGKSGSGKSTLLRVIKWHDVILKWMAVSVAIIFIQIRAIKHSAKRSFMPFITRSNVDFPEPDLPTIATLIRAALY